MKQSVSENAISLTLCFPTKTKIRNALETGIADAILFAVTSWAKAQRRVFNR